MGRFCWVLPACLLVLAACGAEPADGDAERDQSRTAKGAAASTDSLFNADPQVAVVNGEQAATIDINLPANIDTLHPDLASAIRERANRGTEAFIATAQADKQAAAEKGFEFRPHALDVNWIDVGPAEGRLAGYLGTYATYTGGAHPNVGFDVLNWDREAAREIAFTDLFDDADAARTAITSELKGGLLEAKRERLSGMSVDDEELLSAWVNPAFEGDAAVFRGFTIARSSDETKAGGLIYHFAPYEVGAYAEGIYEVGVPYEAFSGMLKRQYRNAFGGTPILP